MTHRIISVGNGENFIRSSQYGIWGINSSGISGKKLLSEIEPGDILWFFQNEEKYKFIAVATYQSQNKREIGPLISTTKTNEELGWYKPDKKIWSTNTSVWTSDTEIHYADLFYINNTLTNLSLDNISNLYRNFDIEYRFIKNKQLKSK